MSDPPGIVLETTIMRTRDTVSADLDDELVVMYLEQNAYYALDSIATNIWQRLEVPISVAVLCDSLLFDFEVEPGQCRTDVLAFLDELYDHSLICTVEPTTA